VVSEKKAEADPSKTEKVQIWPTPSNPDEVRQFLGFGRILQEICNVFFINCTTSD
jgi:hypothetical protein